MIFTPRPYQQRIVDRIEKNESSFIIAAMGAGKTAATIAAMINKLNSFDVARILIIAPLRVAKEQWPSEFKKWENFSQFAPAVAIGTAQQRVSALNQNSEITVINRENMKWLVEHYGKKWPFDMIVIDESSSFKQQSTQRFKALKKIRKLSTSWVLLTGTPSPNSLLELWPQVFLLDGGHRLGKTFSGFRDKYFTSDFMGYSWELRPGADNAIHEKIKDLCVIVESYAGLPDRIDMTHKIDLPAPARAIYNAMKKDFLIELNDTAIDAANAAVLAGKLQQIASGNVYNELREVEKIHSAKINALSELVDETAGDNLFIAYNYRHERAAILNKFPHAVDIKSDGAVDAWNRGEIQMLLAHPASSGHGLNLQDGGRRVVWYSPTWSNELKLQLDARLHRQGQTKTTFVHTIIAADTIDDDIIYAVNNKKTLQDILIRALKK